MGRRPSGALPAMRRHKPTNTARITVAGKVHSLGRWGSPEAQDRYDTLVAAYIASGRRSLDAGKAVIAAPPAPAPATKHTRHDGTGGLTVGELARAWLADIEVTRLNYQSFPITWHPPLSDGGSPLLAYRVYVDGVLVETVTAPQTESFEAAAAGSVVRVSAVNAVGEGPKSDSVVAVA